MLRCSGALWGLRRRPPIRSARVAGAAANASTDDIGRLNAASVINGTRKQYYPVPRSQSTSSGKPVSSAFFFAKTQSSGNRHHHDTRLRSTPHTCCSRHALPVRYYELPCTAIELFFQRALATGDAHGIAAALVTAQARAPAFVESLVAGAVNDSSALVTLLSACVWVCLAENDTSGGGNGPFLFPPWISARVSGITSSAKRPSKEVKNGVSLSSPPPPSSSPSVASTTREGDAAVVAFAAFQELCRQLQEARRGHVGRALKEPEKDALHSLRVFSTLCAVAVAPSEAVALTLARTLVASASPLATVPCTAVGCALASFCQRHHRRQRHHHQEPQQQQGDNEEAEVMWLRLWSSLPVSSLLSPLPRDASRPTCLSPFSLLSVLVPRAPAEQQYLGWHLHCLLATRQMAEAGTQVQQWLRANRTAIVALPEVSVVELLMLLPPNASATSAEAHPIALASRSAAERSGETRRREAEDDARDSDVYAELAQTLLRHLRRAGERSAFAPLSPSAGEVPAPLLYRNSVPAITQNAVLFARMLDHVLDTLLLASAPAADTATRAGGCSSNSSTTTYADRLADVRALLSVANVDALAASLVPAGQPLTEVMVAQTSDERRRKARLLGGAMGKAIHYFCEASSGRRGTWDFSGAARSAEAEAEEAALFNSVGLLSSFLTLTASRESTLPARRAEPRWRRELRARTAVRAHKYQLLLSELPHAEVSAALGRLLNHGYVAQGGALGGCLVREGLVDLRFYSLYLLGSLYHALRTTHDTAGEDAHHEMVSSAPTGGTKGPAEKDMMNSLRALYRRQEELCLAPTDKASAADTLPLPSSTPLTVERLHTMPQSMPVRLPPPSSLPSPHTAALLSDRDGGAALDALRLAKCLMNRTVVGTGGRLVMDGQQHPFDTWVVKGRVTVQL